MESLNKSLEKIELISHISESAISELIFFFESTESEIRFRALEKLSDLFYNEDLPNYILSKIHLALEDDDELVRCEALEIFERHTSNIKYEDVLPLLSDDSSIVRSQAAIVLSKTGDQRAIAELNERLVKSGDLEKVSIYYSLYRLGNADTLNSILSLLESDDYLARCASANLLPDCATTFNYRKIISKLELAYKNERTVAALSSIKNSLEFLKNNPL